MVSESMRVQHETAARSLLAQSAKKIAAREHMLTQRPNLRLRQQIVAELALLKKVNELAAQEVVHWKARRNASTGGSGETPNDATGTG